MAERGRRQPMTETSATSMRPRRNRRVFILLGLLLLLVAYVGCDAWAGHRVNTEVARLEQRYGTLREWYPSPCRPPTIARASSGLPPRSPRSATTRTPRTSSRPSRSHQSREPARPGRTPGVRGGQPGRDPAGRLHPHARALRFEIDHPSGSNEPSWMDIRTLSFAIYLNALMDLDAGHADEAAARSRRASRCPRRSARNRN